MCQGQGFFSSLFQRHCKIRDNKRWSLIIHLVHSLSQVSYWTPARGLCSGCTDTPTSSPAMTYNLWNSQRFVWLLWISCSSSESHLLIGINKWTETTYTDAVAIEGLIKGRGRYASADRRMEELVEEDRKEVRQWNEDEVWENTRGQRSEKRLWGSARMCSGRVKTDKWQKEETDMVKEWCMGICNNNRHIMCL